MNITIKKIGYNVGTSGWLSKGLLDGAIEIREGKTSAGKHGLWLHYADTEKKKQQNLALFDPLGLGNELGFEPKYQTAEDEDFGERNRDAIWTDAAWSSLMEIASQWCDEANADRENDSKISFSISRVAVSQT